MSGAALLIAPKISITVHRAVIHLYDVCSGVARIHRDA
jgi:hypothetical protein